MEFWIQILVNGLMLGLSYALIASGLTLVMGIQRIINFAHGEFYMLGAFGVYWLATIYGVNYLIALSISALIVGGLGLLVERVFYRPVRTSFLRISTVSIGLMIIIPAVTQLAFGAKSRSIGTMISGSVHLFGATVTTERLAVIGVSLLIVLILWYLVQRTKAGMAMRAVAENAEAAASVGIDADMTASLSMFIGCGLAAAAGGMLAPLFYVSPFLGVEALFKAFIVVILGGIGTILGATVAGLLLGFVETLGHGFLLGGWTDVIVFVVVLLVLIFRRGGLLGRASID